MLTQKMKAEFSVYTKTSQWSAITEKKKSDEQKDMKVQSVEKSLKHTKNLNISPRALKSFSLVKLTLLQTTFSIQCVEN